ncbi:hypothetical protein CK203_112691 [Vitis vinifera]|uniref:Retrovirus-related Pol polyprotein from transposon TNT 1-94-like beta-barrel domain-containing protein n=1 Tax=Vitis vinifera TaxID=29760 RepID=A0A438E192_VITVI|nr:hypothetical protein CK203_112691 [Vitis vinifera]
MAIVNKMQIHGDKTEDVTIVEKILRSMTPKFNFVVCSIEESHDIDELSIDELQSSLLVHEQDKVEVEAEAEETMIVEINTNTNAKTTDFKEETRCNYSTTYKSRSTTSPMWSATDVIEKEEEVSLLMACHANQGTHPNLWYIDTGCSNHMCGDNSTFSDLDETFRNSVTLVTTPKSLSWAKEVYEFTPRKI